MHAYFHAGEHGDALVAVTTKYAGSGEAIPCENGTLEFAYSTVEVKLRYVKRLV